MLIRYLKSADLKKIVPQKQPNGSYISTYEDIKTYKVQSEELTSEVDAQVYGADISKIIRLKSPLYELENYLYSKLNNTEDNISKYVIFYNGSKYKIKAVSLFKVDVERL
jgi:hypothetical protein